MFISVVLPQPDGPMIETNSPWRMSRSTPSTTRIGPLAVGKSTPTSSKRRRTTSLIGAIIGRVSICMRAPQAIRSCQATSRRVAARSARSIASAIRPMQMMPT